MKTNVSEAVRSLFIFEYIATVRRAKISLFFTNENILSSYLSCRQNVLDQQKESTRQTVV